MRRVLGHDEEGEGAVAVPAPLLRQVHRGAHPQAVRIPPRARVASFIFPRFLSFAAAAIDETDCPANAAPATIARPKPINVEAYIVIRFVMLISPRSP